MATWIRGFCIMLAIACVASLPAAAHAQATRIWLSGVGDDVNPCSRTAPCKTFAGSISKVASGGTISIIDPGEYGVVTITKPITLEGDCTAVGISAASAASAVLISIPGSGDKRVVLRNLVLDGAGSAKGLIGVSVSSASTVLIDRCLIHNFVNGIVINTAGNINVVISATTIDRIDNAAVSATSTGIATVKTENVRLSNSGVGIVASGGSRVYALRTVASHNTDAGFLAEGDSGVARIFIDHGAATSNGTGVLSYGVDASITMTQTMVTGNGLGIDNSDEVLSYGDNQISDNTTNGTPTGQLGVQ